LNLRSLTIVLPVAPSVNRWKIPIVRGGHSTMIESPEFKAWKEAATTLFRKHMGTPELMTGPLAVSMEIFRARKTGDIDAPAKIAHDVLNGILWEDDSQIVALRILRFDDPANPRLVIRARQVDAPGVPSLAGPIAMATEAVSLSRHLSELRRAATQARAATAKAKESTQVCSFAPTCTGHCRTAAAHVHWTARPVRSSDETPAQRMKRLATSASYRGPNGTV
jgi:Holliday junction resolvase RusA-like endonuclease